MTGHLSKLSPPSLPNAACISVDPEIFFAEDCINPDRQVIEQAREVCLGCVERLKCLSWGMDNEEFGMWGGLTSNERNDLKKKKFYKLLHLKEMEVIPWNNSMNTSRPISKRSRRNSDPK
jgi:WhiB family redox-sensing transcriptional regulator